MMLEERLVRLEKEVAELREAVQPTLYRRITRDESGKLISELFTKNQPRLDTKDAGIATLSANGV